MKKPKRIVVGLNVFERSNHILKRALLTAKENDAELFFVQAIETPWFAVPDFFGSKNIVVDTKAIEEKIEHKIEKFNTENVPYTILTKEGNPSDILLYESKLLKAHMIIMGSHAEAEENKYLLGSTAHTVVHQSHLPVLVVKNRAKGSYSTILSPTDFETHSKQSIAFVRNLCPDAAIKAVHAYEPFYATAVYTAGSYTLEGIDVEAYDKAAKEAAQKALDSLKEELSLQEIEVIDGGLDNREALLNYIEKGGYELIVIGSRGTSGFRGMLGSFAFSLLKETPTDVLVYKP